MAYNPDEHEDEFLRPYTDEAYIRHIRDCAWKNALEKVEEQNKFLLVNTVALRDFLAGKGPCPNVNLGVLLYPGRDAETNYSGVLMKRLCELMVDARPGVVHHLPITNFASQSSVTLIDYLAKINETGPLKVARRAIERIFELLYNPNAFAMGEAQYRTDVKDLFSAFLDACRQNAATFTEFCRDYCEPKGMRLKSSVKILAEHVTDEADRVIAAKAPKRVRKYGHEGNGLKGPKTLMMVRQQRIFADFLMRKPICEGHSRMSRAHECWVQNPAWATARTAQGEARGYASHKSLGAAK